MYYPELQGSVPQFDRFCDMEESVQAIAPVESCESSCITIFEPQYFGGEQLQMSAFADSTITL
ncbi:unnamed protein product [Strongylus vulgaris]|uniref:Uncharacterized protein n=1 Tax=Strongylus vulgaris TaxID=40348 RepID=A0A3P7J6Z9_STRVU|nr:unnamed protein product [Strongylus vulgaris]